MVALGYVVLVGIAVMLLAVRRRAKRRLVAGLVMERPQFSVSPPGGRLGRRRGELL